MQQKTHQPVQIEITEQSREAHSRWFDHTGLGNEDYLLKSRYRASPHILNR